MLEESNTLNTETPEPQPEEKGNRTFLIIGGIFAGLIFLTLVGAAVYFMLIRPRSQAAQTAQEATLSAQRLEQSQALTATAEAAQAASSLSSPMPTHTQTSMPAATDTPVVVVSTSLAPPISDPATLAALQTQLSGQMTQTMGLLVTSQAGGTGPLPTTGFFDEVGLPLMVVITFALVGVIMIARRMRKSTH
jgi:cytoskeletal protein RodZ